MSADPAPLLRPALPGPSRMPASRASTRSAAPRPSPLFEVPPASGLSGSSPGSGASGSPVPFSEVPPLSGAAGVPAASGLAGVSGGRSAPVGDSGESAGGGPRALHVLPALRPAFPGGAPRKGSVLCVDGPGTLGVALVAGVTAATTDGWAAVVGMPEFGVAAAAAMGADLKRLLLVDAPGRQWPETVAALADGAEFVLLRPTGPPAPALTRRLNAVVRRYGCVLAVTGEQARAWEGASLRLRVSDGEWTGLGGGHGHLRARRARLTATGRTGAEHHTWLWLPTPDGTVTPADPPVPSTRPALAPVRRIA